MRPPRTLMMCGAALLVAAAGLSIGQEQGPMREPSTTVAKPRMRTPARTPVSRTFPRFPPA